MYCNVESIDIECTSYTQMHKEYTKTYLPVELGFRLHNDSKMKLTMVLEVYTDRMRYVYKDYSFVSLSPLPSCLAAYDRFAGPKIRPAVKYTSYLIPSQVFSYLRHLNNLRCGAMRCMADTRRLLPSCCSVALPS